jgi:rhodanese-related sulfurtransferase
MVPQPIIFFCNGPQCGQSPIAIRALLDAGYPPGKMLYYRGGLHDWLALGLPVVAGEGKA